MVMMMVMMTNGGLGVETERSVKMIDAAAFRLKLNPDYAHHLSHTPWASPLAQDVISQIFLNNDYAMNALALICCIAFQHIHWRMRTFMRHSENRQTAPFEADWCLDVLPC